MKQASQGDKPPPRLWRLPPPVSGASVTPGKPEYDLPVRVCV